MAAWDASRAISRWERGDWSALLPSLRMHAASEPEAAHMLGALLHGASGSAAVATDLKASAAHYCCCVRRALEIAQTCELRPCVTFPKVFGDAVHAVGSALQFEEVAPCEPEYAACVAALRRVAHDCGRSEVLACAATAAGDAEAAMNAYYALGVDAFQRGDREEAARRYRQTIQVHESAAARSDTRAFRDVINGATANLRILEAKTPEEHALASQIKRTQLMAADPEHFQQRIATRTSLVPVVGGGGCERPACAGCGATPLTLKKCTGSCGGAGEDGKFCSAECFARSWKAHKRKTGCRNKPAAAGGAAGSAAAEEQQGVSAPPRCLAACRMPQAAAAAIAFLPGVALLHSRKCCIQPTSSGFSVAS